MRITALLVGIHGLGAWGCTDLHAAPAGAVPPSTGIYQRATNEFAEAAFYKPAETKTNDLAFTLAPLILQQVKDVTELTFLPDRFGSFTISNGAPFLDLSHPAVYWEADTVQIRGKTHARLCYLWCYSLDHYQAGQGRPSHAGPSEHARPGLPLQGIRITLGAAGQPIAWEVLADDSGVELIFVSQNLEAAALAEFGKPLPGRRFSIERKIETAPNVVVARVIDDSPVALGPFMYLSATTRQVSTLICRCMPAQARKLISTSSYDLVSLHAASTNLLLAQARAMSMGLASFWPGDPTSSNRLEACLRLPEAFFNAPGAAAR
ncbi:MAG: hypothetical protein NT154_10620 [Verrucomicrobia bacterium]|nr:hypothetical protein [Verrucomicrobiota bacterium]